MATTQDFGTFMKDMMGSFPVNTDAAEDAWKTSAAFGEKASAIALDAADKTTDITMGWTMETYGRMGDLAKARPEMSDYAQAMSDFASAQMTSMTEHMTALSEVARGVQTETLDLMLSAGQTMADDATAAGATAAKATETATTKSTAAASTATRRTTAAAKKTTAAATEAADKA